MKILLIDDEEDMKLIFSAIAREEGYGFETAETAETGLKLANSGSVGAVFLDLKLPGMDGIAALKKIKGENPELPVVIITGHETVETAVEAIKLGAYDYFVKPISLEKLKVTVRNVVRTYELSSKVRRLQEEVKSKVAIENIIGLSPQMNNLLASIRKISGFNITVLLLGETGTGKEMAARAIHWESSRHDKPFVPIDCATLPENLIESELFGYEKGTFTGANRERRGRFETADGGTVFLDEIGNIPLTLQSKLLRVVERGEITKLGGEKIEKVDVRIICATNIDLEKAVSEGKFREDLFHRINVFPINLPPLRERNGDIETLAMFFLEKYNREFKKNVKWISEDALDILNNYNWPGNVRELENVIKRAIIMAAAEILPMHLFVGSQKQNKMEFSENRGTTLRELKQSSEKPFITESLRKHKWNKSKAARALGIDYKTLLVKIEEYNINNES